jgi:hypothetical protein
MNWLLLFESRLTLWVDLMALCCNAQLVLAHFLQHLHPLPKYDLQSHFSRNVAVQWVDATFPEPIHCLFHRSSSKVSRPKQLPNLAYCDSARKIIQ